ncbi:hypothetical protein TPB0596_07090 [Tsukamurella pulmonis]|uniref:DUF3349 domain-containing protein n=1 Tax=Tsukamurella pulmonis TaxID=47312 RepID=A0A1H1HFN8_9ACTN|nr:DUF3349 domain-containing protein [Tsukamurella pulmonis]KXO94780.1 hypothetical protein AXK56_19400 [Tsukamurella pulmonis]KXP12801.1 hypothetical protein AXK57_00660 [Tsukamurella pulmonis]RDH11778.1 DUF3349 domain-containing protein [Tsukamurella pulmonis]SDR23938.1 Protein of unknown function [Tsukamurella pulmonis]SUP14933.1 Protein of uncharacterised function (DUF3349) [Tsukamurella pulmonis]
MTTENTQDNVLTQVLDWLRAGYPEGVPPKDYFPLLALLQRQLTETEVDAVIGRLLAARPDEVHREEIEAAIAKVTQTEPSEDDLRQVAGKLAAGGWPLTGFTS